MEDIFRWIPYSMKTPEDFHRPGVGGICSVERSSGRVIGSTRFMNIDRVNRRAEIGSTWIAPAWQRTAVNTEAKYLMLQHAFEAWHCIRVELKTDALNQRSRGAILASARRKKEFCASTW